LRHYRVHARRGVVGLRVAAELHQAQRGKCRVGRNGVVHRTLLFREFRVESDESKNAILPDWTSEPENKHGILGLLIIKLLKIKVLINNTTKIIIIKKI
jgi:hypothetical protein